jgi:hypothetical protein
MQPPLGTRMKTMSATIGSNWASHVAVAIRRERYGEAEHERRFFNAFSER